MPVPRYLCLAGPTASGKTAAALAIAEAMAPTQPVEIISVDSALVYRGMDIGTAKPSAAERARVAHHLIDILDPADAYSAARFVRDAQHLIDAIAARGHTPLLVGGTMLYFKTLFDGIDEMPAADPAIRAELEQRASNEGWPALHAELTLVDPVAAARIAPRDAQRIQRALEVHRVTGAPISKRQTRVRGAAHAPLIALEPRDRAWLHARIAQRFAAMLAAGLVDEVRALRARGDLHPDLPSMRSVGYRQAWAALDDGGIERLTETGTAATRQLAKRQLTWLRGMPQRHVIACDDADAIEQVVRAARALMSGIEA
ncbi:MAG: tRNA (adenosine(37)-N6)-dimethylallyltransferase MiaA [Caldimonas sp.]